MCSLIVVDANIAFRLLCAGAEGIRDRLRPGSGNRFFAPRYLYVELFKHKDRLLKSSQLREADLLEALQALLSRLEFVGKRTFRSAPGSKLINCVAKSMRTTPPMLPCVST